MCFCAFCPLCNCVVIHVIVQKYKFSSLTGGNRLSVFSFHPGKVIDRHGFAMAAPVEWNRLSLNVTDPNYVKCYYIFIDLFIFSSRVFYNPQLYIKGRKPDNSVFVNLECYIWAEDFKIYIPES